MSVGGFHAAGTCEEAECGETQDCRYDCNVFFHVVVGCCVSLPDRALDSSRNDPEVKKPPDELKIHGGVCGCSAFFGNDSANFRFTSVVAAS